MRVLALFVLLLALPAPVLAGDCACTGKATCATCATPAQLAADRTGVCVIELSTCLMGSNPCDWPRHRCAPTLYPCAPCLPVRCIAHKPLACIEICAAPTCLPRACHKPLVTMWVDDPCPTEVILTGSPELVFQACECVEGCPDRK